jgi:single-strand DNA-binding protein
MSIAIATLSGTINKNAEQRSTPNGNTVINLMMNITRYDSRAKQEKSYPVKVTLWGESYVDQVANLTQGTKIVVSGRLQIDQFADKNGKNVRLLNLEASNLNFVSDLNKNNNSNAIDSSVYDELESSNAGSEKDAFDNQEIPF